uniref:exodeoxyribonuclease III n=1 Tax=Pygocentrus nattereri TaxID=42514 RepID=A0AAR2LBR0_PYGNA
MVMHRHLNIISLNVNGLNSPIKRAKILSKMRKEKIDVVMLQETHLGNDEHEKLKKRGVAILFSNSVYFECTSEIKDKEGRYIFVKGKIDNNEVTFCNVYAPPGERWTLFDKIFNLVATETSGILVCAGDFNLILNLDSTNQQRRSPFNMKIRKVMQELGLIDTLRNFNPSQRDYTFYSTGTPQNGIKYLKNS